MTEQECQKTENGDIQGLRIDEIGFGSLKVVQKPEWFCYGIDAVLLADFAKKRKGARITDLGTGTGIIPLILYHKTGPEKIIGVEGQVSVASLAKKTVALNQLEKWISIVNCNVKDAAEYIGKQTQDVVVSNPPYMAEGNGLECEIEEKAIARHELLGNLEDFIACAADLLKEKGDFYMIHRPHRLVDVLTLCREYRLEPKWMRFIQPSAEKKPNLFLVHCIKYGKPELKFLDPLCVYDEKGDYTAEILEIYEREK